MIWPDEIVAYLKRWYPQKSNPKILEGLKRRGFYVSRRSLQEKAFKLGLKKSKTCMKRIQAEQVARMNEAHDAAWLEKITNQAIRMSLNNAGRKMNFSKAEIERRTNRLKEVRTNPESQRKLKKSCKATRMRDIRRVALGLEPLTRIPNIGNALSRNAVSYRCHMKRECGYLTFRFDHRIYYDENTRRSKTREERAEKYGMHVYPIEERERLTT